MQKKAIAIIAVGLVIAISMVAVLTGLSDSYGEEESNATAFDKKIKFSTTSTKPMDAGVFWQNNSYTLVLTDITVVPPKNMSLAGMNAVELKISAIGNNKSTIEECITIGNPVKGSQTCFDNQMSVEYDFSEKANNLGNKSVDATFVLNKGENFSFESVTLQLLFTLNDKSKKSQPIVITVADAHSIDVDANCVVQIYKADSIGQEKTRSEYGSPIKEAVSGSIVMVVPWPSDDGKIISVSVTDSSNNSLEITKKNEYKKTLGSTSSQFVWFFTMPNSNVTVNVASAAHELTLKYEEAKGSVGFGNSGNPISVDGIAVGSEGGYNLGALELMRDKTHFFKDDVVTLIPTANEKDGYSFKGWKIISGDASISGNNLRMGSQDAVIEAIFEKETGISCNPEKSGANVILNVTIDVSDEIGKMADARVLVVAKYGANIINVYSKPVLADGKGYDRIVLSELGLTQVVLQVVDGFQPESDGSISSVCHYIYEPDATR